MAYTFGAGTGDDISGTLALAASSDNRIYLWTCWCRPTTLTNGRYLLSWNTVTGINIDGVTDEVRVYNNRTTDSINATTGVDLVTGTWTFLAVMIASENTGALDAVRVWRGSVDTPPTAVTVTLSTPGSGNATTSAILVIGNNGTAGTVAWQGDIEDVRVISISQTQGETTHPWMHVTSGVITDTEAAFVYQRWILPAWEGKPWFVNLPTPTTWEIGEWRGHGLSQIERAQTVAANNGPSVTTTINGATIAATRGPRPRIGMTPFPERFAL